MIKYIVKNLKKYKIFRILINSLSDFRKDECDILASSISYNFLLSSIPFLILLGSIMGYFFEYIQEIQNLQSVEAAEIILNYIKNIFPMVKEEALSNLFNIKNYKFPLSIIGIICLFFTSTLLFEIIKHSFIKILDAKDTHFIITRLVGLLVIFIIIIISFFLENFLSIIVSKIESSLEEIAVIKWFLELFEVYGFLISLIVTFIFGFILYYTFIRIFAREKNYSKKSIIIGSLFYSVVWNLFKYIYSFYLSKVKYLNIIYGSFTSFIIIFIWVYLTSLLFLYSLELIKNTHNEMDV